MTADYYDPWMLDRTAAWWVKIDRARNHIDSVAQQVAAFRDTRPYSVTPEATDKPDRFAFRLSINRSIPLTLIATIGDAVHNMRASLEALAFELARRSHQGTLTEQQERRSAFPVCATPTDFDQFISARRGLFGQQAERALRAVQPFAITEQAQRLGVEATRENEDDAKFDAIYALNTVWNIDKHRRFTVLTWWPAITYWQNSEGSNRRLFPGEGRVEDGAILFYMEGIDPSYGIEVTQEFNLALKDDPAFREGVTPDVTQALENWHSAVSWAFGRIFQIMR